MTAYTAPYTGPEVDEILALALTALQPGEALAISDENLVAHLKLAIVDALPANPDLTTLYVVVDALPCGCGTDQL